MRDEVHHPMKLSGRTKQCSKGCGSEIYWDEEFKSDSGKFIPLDARTDEPHNCNGPESSEPYFPDEIRNITKKVIPKKIITELKITEFKISEFRNTELKILNSKLQNLKFQNLK